MQALRGGETDRGRTPPPHRHRQPHVPGTFRPDSWHRSCAVGDELAWSANRITRVTANTSTSAIWGGVGWGGGGGVGGRGGGGWGGGGGSGLPVGWPGGGWGFVFGWVWGGCFVCGAEQRIDRAIG